MDSTQPMSWSLASESSVSCHPVYLLPIVNLRSKKKRRQHAEWDQVEVFVIESGSREDQRGIPTRDSSCSEQHVGQSAAQSHSETWKGSVIMPVEQCEHLSKQRQYVVESHEGMHILFKKHVAVFWR